jgi:MFS family permease
VAAHRRAARLLLVAAATSYVGDEICAVALAIAVHDSSHSGPAVAAVVLAALLPRIALAPLTGWLIDSVETTRLLRWTALVQAVTTVALAQVGSLGNRLALLAVVSAGTAVTPNALYALAPTVAGRAGARRLTSSISTASRGSSVLGPIVGAMLVATIGIGGALYVNAASFLAFAAAFAVIGVRRHPAPRSATPVSVAAGLRTLWDDVVLRYVVGVLVAAFVFVGITYVATVFFAKDVLGAGDLGVGLLAAAYGAGMTTGCLGCRWVPHDLLATSACGAPFVIGSGLLLAWAVPALAAALLGYVVAGVASGLALTAMRALVVERVPDGLLGRVFAAEGAIGATGELVALVAAGLLVTAAGPRVSLLVAGAGTLLAPAVMLVVLRPRRERRRQISLDPPRTPLSVGVTLPR